MMIEITLSDFRKGDWQYNLYKRIIEIGSAAALKEHEEISPPDYKLYCVFGGDGRLEYIGRSRDVWSRWFGQLGRLKKNAGGYWFGCDSVSQLIVENMPDSWSWKIQLWTVEDCANHYQVSPKRLDVFTAEAMMISSMSPRLNYMYNSL